MWLYARLPLLLCVVHEALHGAHGALGRVSGREILAGDQNPARLAGKELFFGSVTDPYLPQEAEYGRTRALLEQLQGSG